MEKRFTTVVFRSEETLKVKCVAGQACGGNLHQAFLSFAVEGELGVTSPTSGRINELEKLGGTWKRKASLLDLLSKVMSKRGEQGVDSPARRQQVRGGSWRGQVGWHTVIVISQCGA